MTKALKKPMRRSAVPLRYQAEVYERLYTEAYRPAFERISQLREEVQTRWKFHLSEVDSNKVPQLSLVQLDNKQDHAIVVDSSHSRLKNIILTDEYPSP